MLRCYVVVLRCRTVLENSGMWTYVRRTKLCSSSRRSQRISVVGHRIYFSSKLRNTCVVCCKVKVRTQLMSATKYVEGSRIGDQACGSCQKKKVKGASVVNKIVPASINRRTNLRSGEREGSNDITKEERKF